MRIIACLLILAGVLGFAFAMIMYGDIALTCLIASAGCILSGIGFFIAHHWLKEYGFF